MQQTDKKSAVKKKKYKQKTIYGKASCWFCRESKKIAKTMSRSVIFIQASAKTMQSVLKLQKAPTTIPQIVVNNKHIGGYTNLLKLN